VETGRRNKLSKKLNHFSQVLFDLRMPSRAASLVAAMIRGTSGTELAGFAAGYSFNLSRRQAVRDGRFEPGHCSGRPNHTHATFLCSRALSRTSRARIAVVGNGNTDVGKTATRESGQPIVRRLASSGFPHLRIDHQDGLKREVARKCGAMSEQSADSGRGNEQVPQKLVHLVGYRDPNAGPDPWIRPRPIPAQR
jgi:hypothetical protein